MDRSKLAWFGMGLLIGLGVLLGARMQDGKAKDFQRFTLFQGVYTTQTGSEQSIFMIDNATGKSYQYKPFYMGKDGKDRGEFWGEVESKDLKK